MMEMKTSRSKVFLGNRYDSPGSKKSDRKSNISSSKGSLIGRNNFIKGNEKKKKVEKKKTSSVFDSDT